MHRHRKSSVSAGVSECKGPGVTEGPDGECVLQGGVCLLLGLWGQVSGTRMERTGPLQ